MDNNLPKTVKSMCYVLLLPYVFMSLQLTSISAEIPVISHVMQTFSSLSNTCKSFGLAIFPRHHNMTTLHLIFLVCISKRCSHHIVISVKSHLFEIYWLVIFSNRLTSCHKYVERKYYILTECKIPLHESTNKRNEINQ